MQNNGVYLCTEWKVEGDAMTAQPLFISTGGTNHSETISKGSADFVVSISMTRSQISAFVK